MNDEWVSVLLMRLQLMHNSLDCYACICCITAFAIRIRYGCMRKSTKNQKSNGNDNSDSPTEYRNCSKRKRDAPIHSPDMRSMENSLLRIDVVQSLRVHLAFRLSVHRNFSFLRWIFIARLCTATVVVADASASVYTNGLNPLLRRNVRPPSHPHNSIESDTFPFHLFYFRLRHSFPSHRLWLWASAVCTNRTYLLLADAHEYDYNVREMKIVNNTQRWISHEFQFQFQW